jgi:hypothetical protein
MRGSARQQREADSAAKNTYKTPLDDNVISMEHSDDIAESHNLAPDDNMIRTQDKNMLHGAGMDESEIEDDYQDDMGGIEDQYEEDFGAEGSNPGLTGSMPRSSQPSGRAMNDPADGLQDLKSVPGAHSDRLEESMP